MNSVRETVKDKNPYKRGADDGLFMGGIMIVMFLAMTQAATSVLASWIGLLLAFVGVPVATFIFLRRSYLKDSCLTLFSSLWVQGIVMFFCATLLLAFFEYLYLRVLNPTFLVKSLTQAADFYSRTGTEQGTQMATILHNMIHQNLIPSAISVAIETIWVGVFTGSLLSALMSGIVRMKIWRNR